MKTTCVNWLLQLSFMLLLISAKSIAFVLFNLLETFISAHV